MTERLVRFGVAMEASLLVEFDRVVKDRGTTRSEVLRDLARATVVRAQLRHGAPAIGTLTLVYDHHVRDLTEKLTELQHELGGRVRSTLHVHLDHDNCLEVIILEGRSDELQGIADRLLGLRGVKHGGIEIVTGLGKSDRRTRTRAPHTHAHAHTHAETRVERRAPRKRTP